MKNSSIRFIGTGPGPQTQDGCSVELYRRLRAGNEPDIIASVVANHGSILELGAGAGRVTHPLIARGYQLTVVDNSPEMLAHIRGAEAVFADIETLDLGRQFDAVLLGSHLINFPDAETRSALLAACKRHVRPEGAVLIERHDPEWLAGARPGPIGTNADVLLVIEEIRRESDIVHLRIRAEAGDGVWTQCFATQILDDRQIHEALRGADLRFVAWLDDKRRWLRAHR